MQQDTVKIVTRTVGIVLALAVLTVAGLILKWYYGTPWAASDAAEIAQSYIDEHYSRLNLTLGEPQYHLATRGYTVEAVHPTQQDVHFTVWIKKDAVTGDSYETDVAQKANTTRRLESSCSYLAQQLLDEAQTDLAITAKAYLDTVQTGTVALNMRFDPAGELNYHLMLFAEAETADLSTLCTVLQQAHLAMEGAGLPFTSYGAQIKSETVSLTAAQITPAQIVGGNLPNILQLVLDGHEDADPDIYLHWEGGDAPAGTDETSDSSK